MLPQKFDLESFVEGCHWAGIPSLTIQVNGAAPASAITAVSLRFAKIDTPETAAVALSNGAGITITSAANWQLAIPKQAVPGLTAGRWNWLLKITSADGVIDPYLTGVLTVLSDV